jgi:hypothetical protein
MFHPSRHYGPVHRTVTRIHTDNKDGWERARAAGEIVAGVIVPVALVVLGFLLNLRMKGIESKLQAAGRDLTLMTEFHRIYSTDKSRRLAPYFIRCIDDKNTKLALRQFVTWDVLERNLSPVKRSAGSEACATQPARQFRFDPELDDWHLLGDVLKDMKKDWRQEFGAKDDQFPEWWDLWVKRHTLNERWTSERAELQKLYVWLDHTYALVDGAPTPAPSPPAIVQARTDRGVATGVCSE